MNITDQARNLAEKILDPFCQIIVHTKASPDILSVIGLLFAGAACITIALGHIVYGGCLVRMCLAPTHNHPLYSSSGSI